MGTKGRLMYDYDHFTTVNYERPNRLRLITEDEGTDIGFPEAPAFSEGSFRQFVAGVLHDRPLEVTGEDGRAALGVALAAYKSASADVLDLYGLRPASRPTSRTRSKAGRRRTRG